MDVVNVHTESPRFPDQRYSYQGEPGAKPNPNGAGDAYAVNIPQPATRVLA